MDSHPVDVCRQVRAGRKERLGGLAQRGYCVALDRWFHGVREHLVFTPGGYIACLRQLPGNRHDVQGLYSLMNTAFRGHLLGDNAYWPSKAMRPVLAAKGITICAASRSNWHFQYPPEDKARFNKLRKQVERRISLFNMQFHAGRTLCRSLKHYLARRLFKTAAHNSSRHVNTAANLPLESLAHFRFAS